PVRVHRQLEARCPPPPVRASLTSRADGNVHGRPEHEYSLAGHSMRYVIYGAGAIGAAVGARLAQHGYEAILVARGAHLEALQREGVHLRTPSEDFVQPVTAVGHPSEIAWR